MFFVFFSSSYRPLPTGIISVSIVTIKSFHMFSCKIATTIIFELPADISHPYFLLTAIASGKLEVTKHQGI